MKYRYLNIINYKYYMTSEEMQTVIIQLNKTFVHHLADFSFGNLPKSTIIDTFKDGRAFAHFIEPWLAINYPLIHIKGCKNHDFIDEKDENIKYDQKTFTERGCNFTPSNMIG